jgi:nifR3 family TIM-barrel protein
MAGITNAPFRLICRQFGRGLFVCEMVTARALVELHPKTLDMLRFDRSEMPRSVQLYGVDPVTIAAAVKVIRQRDLADHIDLNFGCPVPKVTRRGGGAALPWKRELFRRIVGQAVTAAGPLPVTVKLRLGIDREHLTFLDAGLAAEAEGAAGLTLHARTAAQHYSGQADWSAIAELKLAVRSIPVLGNGDVFSAADAVRLLSRTGCDGVVVGRGCLGRPWLFADLDAALCGRPERLAPNLGFVIDVIRQHALLLIEHTGEEGRGLRLFRAHLGWYLKAYRVGAQLRRAASSAGSLAELENVLEKLDRTRPYPGDVVEGPRAKAGGGKAVRLPDGWLDSRN